MSEYFGFPEGMEMAEDLARVVDFHGHFCPGMLIGYRAARAGLARLAAGRSADEELVAMVENDSCAVDAVQVITGATFGKGNLVFLDHGKQVFTFALRPSGRAARLALKPDAFGPGGLSRDEKTRLLLTRPDYELFAISDLTVQLPPEAEIRKSVVCARCGEAVMETRAREVRGRKLCIPCSREET